MTTAIVLSCLCLLGISSSAAAAADRVANASAEYSFLYSDVTANLFPDISTRGLLGQLSYPNRASALFSKTYPTLTSNGVIATGKSDYIASSNISNLTAGLTSSSMTIELWLQLNQTEAAKTSFLSFTSTSSQSSCHDYFKVISYNLLAPSLS
jgi:hypothetical protein